jgi:uroporphyrinogen III methyltransferase / synthase
LPDQRTIVCRLNEVADVFARSGMRPPVLVIVGDVAALGPRYDWFTRRPLFGQRVLVTRPYELHNLRGDKLRPLLAEFGAEVVLQPVIEIEGVRNKRLFDELVTRLQEFSMVVFASANGADHFLRQIAMRGDARLLGGIKLAAIGPGTALEMLRYSLRADFIPNVNRAEALADALAPHVAGRRVLLVRGSRGREVLAERLVAAGAGVEQVVAYQSTDVAKPDPEVAAALAAGTIDWITVTSSSIARSLVRLFGEDLRRAKLVSISPITSDTLRENGFEPAAQATDYTMAGVVDSIAKYERERGQR